jgi:hypothetical protein
MADNLPHDHHVARYVPYQRTRRDEDDNVVGILAEAFRLRPGEQGLSVTWIEQFAGGWDDQLQATAAAIRRSQKVGSKSAFAWALVGEIHRICKTHSHRVRIIHLPEAENSGHSEIRQLPRDDLLLLEMLATEAFAEYRLNSQIS